MPYKSLAQERFFHTDTAKKKGITGKQVKEFDEASKGIKLKKKANKGPKLENRFNSINKYLGIHNEA